MFVVRQHQMDRFKDAALASFEDEMVVHCKGFLPLVSLLGEEQLREIIHQAIGRAACHGFTCRGPVRLFIELTLLFGCAFDTDPLYAWAAESLKSEPPASQQDDDAHPELVRASELYQKTLEVLDDVAGPNGMFTRRGLQQLRALLWFSPPSRDGDIIPMMCEEVARAYPQKAGHAPDGALERLLQKALDEAAAYGMVAADEQALFCVLLFAFGQGCTGDPQYPWIARTLKREQIAGDESRIARLRSEAVTWLDHVIASYHPGEEENDRGASTT